MKMKKSEFNQIQARLDDLQAERDDLQAERDALLAPLDAKFAKQREPLNQLDKSLTIKSLWPEAFDHGACTSHIQGNVVDPLQSLFVIKDGSGTERSFNIKAVPFGLLPEPFIENGIHNAAHRASRRATSAFARWVAAQQKEI